VARAKFGQLLHSEPFENGTALFEECVRRGLEGVVAKRADAPYRAGRTGDWLKTKCEEWKAVNRERHRLFERR
jgi:ATP-dependent DNA ligase